MSPDQNIAISKLIAEIKSLDLPERIRIFGSVAKNTALPGDLDCVIDFDDPVFEGELDPSSFYTGGLTNLPALYQPSAAHLLTLCRDPLLQGAKGPLLNCFVRFERRILAPNSAATWWLPALPATALSIWQKARTHGQTLSDLTWARS